VASSATRRRCSSRLRLLLSAPRTGTPSAPAALLAAAARATRPCLASTILAVSASSTPFR